MNILFDGTTLCGSNGGPGAGIEHYSASLLRAMIQVSKQDTFFVVVPSRCSTQLLNAIIGAAKNVRVIRNFYTRIPGVGRHVLLPLRASLARPDVYFSPFGQLPLGWLGKNSVVTVHDVSIFDHPEWFPEEVVKSWTTRFVVPNSLKRAEKIICVSRFTQSRLHDLFAQTKGKTKVVYEGVEMGNHKEVEHTQHMPFDREYILMLGTIEPRKNLAHSFRAFENFLSSHPEQAGLVRLIVAGKLGWKTKEIEETAAVINHSWKHEEPEGVIRFLGAVTEEEKWYLLSRAAGLLFLSHEEGFGLPVLEAMSVGTPVITSRTGALEEVAGDAALFVDPEDLVAATLAISQCILVPEGLQSFREQGYRRAQQLSWQQTALQTLEVFHSFSN